ncbi:MAG: mechanosensitive ion channel family protein, partial [Phycisphaerae bacterium]
MSMLSFQVAEVADATSGGSPAEPAAPAKAPNFVDTLWNSVKEPWTFDTLISKLSEYGPMLLKAAAVFIIGRMVARVVTDAVGRAATRARVDETLSRFGCNVLY